MYEVPLSMNLLGFRMGIMLANFDMCGIMLVLRAAFNMFVRNASPRGHMCFMCLMFILSGPCELILTTMWSGKSLKLLCNLPFGMLCLSAICMMFVKIMLTVGIFVGMVV